MIRKSPALALSIVVCSTLLLAGCAGSAPASGAGASAPTPAAGVAPVKVAEVVKGSLSNEITYQANVQAKKQATVVSKLPGRIVKVNVDVGAAVKAGDVLIEMEQEALQAQVAQAEASLEAAEAKLAGLLAGPRAEQVSQAEANLKIAQARLDQMKAGPTAEQIAQAEAQVRLAKNQLFSVQTQADAYLGSQGVAMGAIIFTKEMKEAQSGVAWEQVQAAEAALAQLKAGPSAEEIAQAEGAVEAAQQQLALARQPLTTYDVRAAQASVAQAKAVVDLAKTQLADATIKAPFDGVVAQKMVSEGAMAASGTPLLALLAEEVELVINVDEASLANVEIGQTGTILANAYPGRALIGTVVNIAPSVDPRSRTVAVRLVPSDGAALLDGMSAQVRLSLKKDGVIEVLMAPTAAVIQDNGESVVFVISDGKAQRRVVATGTSDGERIEIKAGLSEGEKVAVSGLTNLKEGQEVEAQ